MISRIHSTTIVVNDQDAALDFYVNKLGWDKAMDSPIATANNTTPSTNVTRHSSRPWPLGHPATP